MRAKLREKWYGLDTLVLFLYSRGYVLFKSFTFPEKLYKGGDPLELFDL